MAVQKTSMSRSTRGLFLLLIILVSTVLGFALMYMLGETFLEHRPRSFLASLEWAAETLTTTGYGADSSWQHPLMVVLVILTQFSGLFLLFLILPFYVLPYFEERFEARLPQVLPKLRDYVLIFHYSPAVASLIEELKRHGRKFVVLEQTRAAARDVQQRGLPIVLLDLVEDSLPVDAIDHISAVVANGNDEENTALIMLMREQGFNGQILAFADTPQHRLPMQHVGATAVFTPRHLLSEALAARASRWVTSRVRGVQELGEQVGVYKLRVQHDSTLAGQTLKQAELWQHGVNVIGMWSAGQFIDLPPADTKIAAGSVMVCIGSHAALAHLGELARPLTRSGPFLICGNGRVGRKVAQMLRDAQEPVVVVSDRDVEGVDIVGNVLDSNVLKLMAARKPSAIILAIGNDTQTLFLATVVRDYLPDVPLLARVNQAHSVDRLHRLGADFALSVDRVAGELLASRLLGEEYIEVEPELRVNRLQANGLEGQHPRRVELLERFGCKIVAVARSGEVLVEFDDNFLIQKDDEIFLCGSPQSIEVYLGEFPQDARQQ
ncbi:MAG: NAD-binding protein [Lysobacterales bacterium]